VCFVFAADSASLGADGNALDVLAVDVNVNDARGQLPAPVAPRAHSVVAVGAKTIDQVVASYLGVAFFAVCHGDFLPFELTAGDVTWPFDHATAAVETWPRVRHHVLLVGRPTLRPTGMPPLPIPVGM
jgi:hypothetical protein